jgi:hypothetical protein
VSVESNRNGETEVYIEVNEDFEHRIDSNHSGAAGFERGLMFQMAINFHFEMYYMLSHHP